MDIQALFSQARDHAQAGRVEDAIACLEAIVQADPAAAPAWLNLGVLKAKIGDSDGGEAALVSATEAAPDLREAHFQLASLRIDQDRWADAAPPLEVLLHAAPADVEVLINLGSVYLRLGRPGDAEASFARAKKHLAGEPELDLLLATAIRRQGRFEEALSHFDAVLKQIPDHADAWRQTGLCRQNLGDVSGAFEAYRTALGHDPDLYREIFTAIVKAPHAKLPFSLNELRQALGR